MIREEYDFSDIDEYLYQNMDLLIAGEGNEDDRSHFLPQLWQNHNKEVLFLRRELSGRLSCRFVRGDGSTNEKTVDLCVGTCKYLRHLGISQKNVLLDLSSLDHVLIMFLAKQLVERVVPKSFFAAYIRPNEYSHQSGTIGSNLCEQILAVESVPGFAKRESENQTLCSFVGFEGIRLKGVLETVHNIGKFIPVVAFPSGTPQWYNVTIWNSMDILQDESKDVILMKCFSESVFEAVDLLKKNIAQDERVVLAPLGTRPHSLACALFACHHQNSRIIYDFAVERKQRTRGIASIVVYHLTSFLKDRTG